MDLSKYRQLFVSETHEMLDTLGQSLVILENTPDSDEAVNTTFRLFHSLKGMSGTMGFTPFFDLAHLLEELMDRVRAGRLTLGSPVVDLLLAGVDRFRHWIEEIDNGDAPEQTPDVEKLHGKIEHLLRATEQVNQPTSRAPDRPLAARPGDLIVQVRLAVPVELTIRGYLLARRLGRLGSVIDTVPSLEQLRAGRCGARLRVAIRGASEDRVRAFVEALPDWTDLRIECTPAPRDENEDDIVFTGSFGAPATRPTPPPRESAIIRRPEPQRSLRVQTAWIDQVLSRTEAVRLAVEGLGPAHSRLRTLVDALMTETSAVRMVPISVLTDRLPRVVRDMAREVGKRAMLVVESADERVDRAIVEGIDTALTHLVRNAVEHGIERPSVRAAANKPEVGTITLRCRRAHDAVIIELADDGGGVDAERLIQRAIESQLVAPDAARRWASRDLCRLLCVPGLTTRTVANAGAGRGIGMDAVASTIEGLGGHVSVRSRPAHGTVFSLHLPRTRGVTGLRIVVIGGQKFAVHRAWIDRELAGPAVKRAEESVCVGDERWPLLEVPGRPAEFGGVVLLLNEPRAALEVDAIIGNRDMLIQPMPAPFDQVGTASGVARLASGEPVLVLALRELAVR